MESTRVWWVVRWVKVEKHFGTDTQYFNAVITPNTPRACTVGGNAEAVIPDCT
jgi:hypothetical protein